MLIVLLPALGISLLLTLVLEGLFGLIWGIKGRRDWLLLLLANAVTNPIVVTLHYCVSSRWVFVLILEVSAVLAEWLAYRKWGKTLRPAFLFSLCANCFSYFSGLLLNYFIF